MPVGIVASALIPAFCEEAIRSSYVYYLAERGRRQMVVLSLAAVFVLGEAIYDISLYSTAKAEFGSPLAGVLLIIALVAGAILHLGLTFWTADRHRAEIGVLRVFALALLLHGTFNIIAMGVLRALLW